MYIDKWWGNITCGDTDDSRYYFSVWWKILSPLMILS